LSLFPKTSCVPYKASSGSDTSPKPSFSFLMAISSYCIFSQKRKENNVPQFRSCYILILLLKRLAEYELRYSES
jgi:hypothetical protein